MRVLMFKAELDAITEKAYRVYIGRQAYWIPQAVIYESDPIQPLLYEYFEMWLPEDFAAEKGLTESDAERAKIVRR